MYSNFDISRLSFNELKEGKNSKGQKNAYPEYNHPSAGPKSPLFIQFPWLELSTYGIPKIGEYIKSDSERLYIKCPLDLTLPEINDLYNKLFVKLDNHFDSNEFKTSLFGKKASKYDYNPIFKTPRVSDDDDDDENDSKSKKSTIPKPPFIKLRFDVSYPNYPDYNIKTIIFNDKKEKINDIVTISDVEKYVCWKCRFRPIVRLSKIWAQSVGTGKYGPGYGATFTIIKMQVEPPLNNGLGLIYKKYQEEDTFLDNDDDNNKIKLNKKAHIKDSESDSETKKLPKKPTHILESDDESDDEPIKKPIKIESDNESEQEIKPKKQVNKQQKLESESEEEIKPIKSKKNVKKNK
jgi:hypothetical protein